MAKGRNPWNPKAPPEFAELFADCKEEQAIPRLRSWMEAHYGSRFAELYNLVKLAFEAERESVRYDALRHLIALLYGDQPAEVVRAAAEKHEAENRKSAAPVPTHERIESIVRILKQVGGLPERGAAV